MRIAVGQLWQETNTFNRNPTTLSDFKDWGIATGADVLGKYGETGELGGFVAECATWNQDIEFVGLARMVCWPWGSIDVPTWHHIRQTFIERLQAAGKVDGVLLALHGALCAENEFDVTGALLQLTREIVGPHVPIVGTLDLHANITPQMMNATDLLVGYHTSPHLDHFETGQRGVRGLRRMIEQGTRPQKYYRKLPMMTPAESHNSFTGVPAPLYRKLEALERDPRVLSAGLYMVMPWLDCPQLGWTITLHTEKPDPEFEKVVEDLADECWRIRPAMCEIERYSPEEVVSRAKALGVHPIAIGDGADATNSGCPGDSTALLREFLKQQPIPHGALTFVVDPDAVAAAYQSGVGGTFDMHVGATFSPEYSNPVRVQGSVEKLLPMKFILNGHGGKQMPIDMGRAAVIKSGDVSIVLTERTGPGSTPLLYETAGLDPRTCGMVVSKSPAGFRADYEPFCKAILLADGPGCATPNFPRLKFDHISKPLWPLQEVVKPEDAAWCKT